MTGMQYLTYLADIYEVPAQNRMERIEGLARRLDIVDALGRPHLLLLARHEAKARHHRGARPRPAPARAR